MNNYYKTCPFPKPVDKKKKTICNGYKDKPNRVCAYTGAVGAERHELFGGPNRKISIMYDFQVDVSPEKHRELQDNVTEWAQEENKRLRAEAQKNYMDRLIEEEGITEKAALREWMFLIGRNYRPELMPE